jgi:hypothetical protein
MERHQIDAPIWESEATSTERHWMHGPRSQEPMKRGPEAMEFVEGQILKGRTPVAAWCNDSLYILQRDVKKSSAMTNYK